MALLIGELRSGQAAVRSDLRATRSLLKKLETKVDAMHDRLTQAAIVAGLWLMGTLGNWKLDEVAQLLLTLAKGAR